MILLSIGMPIWNAYKHINIIRAALIGASAAVVGLIGVAYEKGNGIRNREATEGD